MLSMNDLSAILGAVAHPARRDMVLRLSGGSARVTEIAAPFAISLNAVSKHVKILEGAGLVRRERSGRDHIITLNAEPLRLVVNWVHQYEHFWTRRLDRFQQHFAKKQKTKSEQP